MDFTQSFLQGVQQGQARALAKKREEQEAEEFDLKKQMLKVEMQKLDIAQKVAARKAQEEAADAQKGVPGSMVPRQPSPNDLFAADRDTDQGIPGEPAGPPAPPVAAPELFRRFKIPGVPEAGIPEYERPIPTQEGLIEAERQKEMMKRSLPPTSDQIADNKRLEMEATARIADRKAAAEQRELSFQALEEDRKFRRQMAAQNALNLSEYRRDSLRIREDMANDRQQRARDLIAAKEVSPEAAEYLARAVADRRVIFESLRGEQEKPVAEAMARLGLTIPRKLTAKELNAQTDASAGLNAVDNLEDLLNKDPNLPTKAAFAGALGPVSQYLARKVDDNVAMFQLFRGEMADIKTRIRTGAAVNDQELKFYQGQGPAPGEPPAVWKKKLNHFRGFYLSVSGKQVALTSPTGEKRIITDGYDPKQRTGMRKLIDAGWVVEEM